MRYFYDPTVMIQAIHLNTKVDTQNGINRDLDNQAKVALLQANKLKDTASVAVKNAIISKYLSIAKNGLDNYLALLSKHSPYFPHFKAFERNYFDSRPNATLSNLPEADPSHAVHYQLARASRSFPVLPSSAGSSIETRREAIIDALCYIAAILESTVELANYKNLVDFITTDERAITLSDKALASFQARLDFVNSANPNKHRILRKLIADSFEYSDEQSVLPLSTCIKPFGLRASMLSEYGFDIKNNTNVDQDTVKDFLKLTNLLHQSYLRLPIELLATLCEEQDIKTYFSGLLAPEAYGMVYPLTRSEYLDLTLSKQVAVQQKGLSR